MDVVVATSPNYLATSSVLAKYIHKTKVIPIGLCKASYPKASTDRLLYWQERIGPKFFLFVGNLRYYKGLHILIEALQGSDYPVVIAGSGPIEQDLKTKAAGLGLHNIHFVGYQSDEDKVALLTLCYGVLFPSHLRSEAFGISLLEGAMYGKPLISSEIGTGTCYVNINGETGLVVPPSDPIALSQAMVYLWERPIRAAEMGRCAEERYLKYFTAERMVNSYVDLYKELLNVKSLI
jgi:rhamnosyl/mannosyltransferase